MTNSRHLAVALVTATIAFGGAVGARAQSAATPSSVAAPAGDARWTAWLGCWRAVDDFAGTGARVCVTRAGNDVTLQTVVGGQIVSEDVRVADGAERPVRESDCTGTTTSHWSADGHRAYRTATASCGTDESRTLAGVDYFVPGPVWVDVQTVTLKGATNVRVSRYTRAQLQRLPDGTAVPAAPSRVAAPVVSRGWTTDEVVEASRVLPPDGVQAAIGEGPTAFRLNAASLSRMADGGVAEGVIDLVVALTYPEKFTVDRATSWGGSSLAMGSTLWADPFFAQIVGPAALYDCYSPYGWASDSYWSGCSRYNPYLYGNYPGYYNGYYGANGPYGTWVSTSPGPGPGNGPTEGGGRLINGRGYTQVHAIDTSNTGTANGDRSSGNGSNTNTSDSGGSTSGGATSSGYSGGGGAGGGGNFAVPRPPGS